MSNSVQKPHLREFKDFLKLANFFFAAFGFNPYGGSEKMITLNPIIINVIFYIGIINLNLNMAAVIGGAINGFQSSDSFIEAITACTHIGFVLASEVKVFYFWWKKDLLTRFLAVLKKMFPDSVELQNDFSLEQYYKRSDFITRNFSISYIFLITVYNFFAAARNFVDESILGKNVADKDVPYVEYIPWEYKDNYSFYLIYTSQVLAGFTSVSQVIASDLLFCSLTIQITMHYDYLSKKIRSYQIQSTESPQKAWKDHYFMKEVVIYHNQLLKYKI